MVTFQDGNFGKNFAIIILRITQWNDLNEGKFEDENVTQ